jgi:hypothetical protein
VLFGKGALALDLLGMTQAEFSATFAQSLDRRGRGPTPSPSAGESPLGPIFSIASLAGPSLRGRVGGRYTKALFADVERPRLRTQHPVGSLAMGTSRTPPHCRSGVKCDD